MPSAQRGFGHLLMILVMLILAFCVVVAIWLIMQQPQTPNQLSQIQPASAQETTSSAEPVVQNSVRPISTAVPTSIVMATSAPMPALENGKVYNGRGIVVTYPSNWRYDNKTTSSTLFGSLHLMNALEFDVADSTNKDPEGLLLGRIELKVFNNTDLANKTADEYIQDHFSYGSPEVTSTRTINGVEVKEVHHKNCGEANDCIDVVVKNGTGIYDWQVLNVATKQEDLQLVYSMLNQAVYK